jgi:hypothetical protein
MPLQGIDSAEFATMQQQLMAAGADPMAALNSLSSITRLALGLPDTGAPPPDASCCGDNLLGLFAFGCCGKTAYECKHEDVRLLLNSP